MAGSGSPGSGGVSSGSFGTGPESGLTTITTNPGDQFTYQYPTAPGAGTYGLSGGGGASAFRQWNPPHQTPPNYVAPDRTLFPGEEEDACNEWGTVSHFSFPNRAATEPRAFRVGDLSAPTPGKPSSPDDGRNKEIPDPENPNQGSGTRDFTFKEVERTSKMVRIVSPQDSSTWIDVERILTITFEGDATKKRYKYT